MLKIISSKNESLIFSEIKKIKVKEKISGSTQTIDLELAESRAQDVSIFGDREVYLVNIKSENIDSLEQMNYSVLQDSTHLFILVGSGAEFEKSLDKYGQKGNLIKLVEKAVFDFPAELVSALQKNDKKNAWGQMVKELANKDAEPIHGSCVFAYKSLLVYLNDVKKNSVNSGVKDFSWGQAKRNGMKRESNEVVDKYFNLVVNYHKARMGQGNLAKQLELWVLG